MKPSAGTLQLQVLLDRPLTSEEGLALRDALRWALDSAGPAARESEVELRTMSEAQRGQLMERSGRDFAACAGTWGAPQGGALLTLYGPAWHEDQGAQGAAWAASAVAEHLTDSAVWLRLAARASCGPAAEGGEPIAWRPGLLAPGPQARNVALRLLSLMAAAPALTPEHAACRAAAQELAAAVADERHYTVNQIERLGARPQGLEHCAQALRHLRIRNGASSRGSTDTSYLAEQLGKSLKERRASAPLGEDAGAVAELRRSLRSPRALIREGALIGLRHAASALHVHEAQELLRWLETSGEPAQVLQEDLDDLCTEVREHLGLNTTPLSRRTP